MRSLKRVQYQHHVLEECYDGRQLAVGSSYSAMTYVTSLSECCPRLLRCSKSDTVEPFTSLSQGRRREQGLLVSVSSNFIVLEEKSCTLVETAKRRCVFSWCTTSFVDGRHIRINTEPNYAAMSRQIHGSYSRIWTGKSLLVKTILRRTITDGETTHGRDIMVKREHVMVHRC